MMQGAEIQIEWPKMMQGAEILAMQPILGMLDGTVLKPALKLEGLGEWM